MKTDPDGLLLLYQLSRFANLSPDVEESLQAIAEELANTFQPDRMFIALLEPDGTSLTCLARFPLDEAETKFSRTMLRHLLHEKQVLIIQDALTDERLVLQGKPAKSVLEQHIQSALCIPLQWGREIKGILYLDSSKEKGRFTSRELKLLTHVGKDLSALLERGLDYRSVRDEKLRLESRLALETTIIGITPKIKELLKTIERLAATDATILLTGETGTGKDLAARVIHQNSRRQGKPFIEVNCAAIPENILESELFGVIAHYPGFHNKEALKGRFELAHGGAIFLNEIGDLPERLQAKLLDVLETKRIWPLGKSQPTPVDIRIIAATNKDLEHEIGQGRFRGDLYERLHLLHLRLPPLRERKEDIPLLAGYFLYRLRQEYGKKINRLSNTVVDTLLAYDWPRNVRELKNTIERAVILTDRSVITPDLFEVKSKVDAEPKSLAQVEQGHIMNVLEYTDGNKGKAARILGITRQTLYTKGLKYNLPGFEERENVLPAEHTEDTEGIE